jgi:hypothetical protein
MSKPSDIQYANDFLKHIVPYVSEEQVQCWLETTKNDAIEIIKMIANGEMHFSELRQEIFDNPDWDPTEE